MSFAINPSLNHIDVPEACVHELYRSSAAVVLPDARFRGHACEAYICIAKIDKEVKAYIGLLETGMNTVLVYTSDFVTSNPAESPEVYKQAAAFVGAMGFTMEPVNLSFSAAMREVIIKGFRVMRPPPPKKQKPAIASGPASIDRKKPAVPVMQELSPLPAEPSDELASVRRELAAAKTAIAQLTREKVQLEQSATKEINSLKASCAQAVEAKQRATAAFAAEAEKLRQEGAARAIRSADDEKAALSAELMKATEAAQATEHRLQAEIAALHQQMAQLVAENRALEQGIATERTRSAEQRKLFTEEKEALLARLAANEAAAVAAADKIATLALFETSWREGQQREEDLCRNLDLMNNQLDLLQTELHQYREQESREKALQLQVSRLEEELAAARTQAEPEAAPPVPESVLAELHALQESKAAVEAEYVRFANERSEKEAELLDSIAAAEMEIVRLSREIEIRTQLAAREQAAMQAELRQLAAGSGTVVSGLPAEVVSVARPAITITATPDHQEAAAITPEPPAAPPLSPPVMSDQPVTASLPPETPPALDDGPDRPIPAAAEIIAGLMNDFGSFRGSSGYSSTEFTVDPALTSVVYSKPEEIAVLLYSSNSVQAVPDGSSIQRCKGYVIATRDGEAFKVYVAWYLTESKKVVVCTPQQQPADSDECTQILLDAITYFEIVGFMMELAELGESSSSYNRALAKIPVVSRQAAP